MKIDLKTGDRIVGDVEPVEDGVFLIEGENFDAVVQDGVALGVVVGDQVRRVFHLLEAISVAGHGKLADLKTN